MRYMTIEVGSFQVNASIVHDGETACIIDPGGEAGRIADILASKNLKLEKVLLTHAHFDHIGAVAELEAAFPGLGVFVPPGDIAVYTHPMNRYPPDYPPRPLPENLLSAPEVEGMETIPVPGHTPGGVAYYFPAEKVLFSGDTLFAGSVGRTDLPGGDMAALMKSLSSLKALPDDTVVVPGHGRATTIGEEKAINPFLKI